jgi:protein ImuB
MAVLEDSLDAQTERTPDGKERAKCRLLQINPAAIANGVAEGMTAAQGQARCPDLQILPRVPADETRCQQLLLAQALHLCADVESTAAGVCTLDLIGCDKSIRHTGADTFIREALDGLATFGLDTRAGLATAPDLARLAARFADPVRLITDSHQDLRRFLDPLPIEALDLATETLEVLDAWGIRTLGELLALPREDAIERLGPDALACFTLAAGGTQRLLRLVQPPAVFRELIEIEHAVTSTDPLLFLLRRLLDTLTARLKATWLTAGEMILGLHYEDDSDYERLFRIPEPCSDPEPLFRVLQTHLENFIIPAPVDLASLELKPAPGSRRQFDFFESSFRDPNRFADTLAPFQESLGKTTPPAPVAVTRADKRQLPPAIPENASRQGLPLRRFRPPLHVQVRLHPRNLFPQHITAGPIRGEVIRHTGPWISNGQWWTPDRWHIREWDVQINDGRLLRLTHRNKPNEQAWFIEGCYG